MTVIIQAGGRTGRDRTQTVKNLVALANGNVRHIVSTTGGIQVPDELAFEYLSQFHAPAPVIESAPVEVVKVNAETGAEATPLVESEPDTEPAATPPRKRKPRKTSTTSDGGAE